MPHDIGYVKCDLCIDGDHNRCLGMDENEPLCGCRCPWLEIYKGD